MSIEPARSLALRPRRARHNVATSASASVIDRGLPLEWQFVGRNSTGMRHGAVPAHVRAVNAKIVR